MNPIQVADRWRQWHERPSLIEFASTPAGKALVVVATLATLWPRGSAVVVIPILALVQLFPNRRIDLLACGGLWVLFDRSRASSRGGGLVLGLIAALVVLTILWLAFQAARGFPRLPAPIRRRPIVALLVALGAVLGTVWAIPRVLDLDPASPGWHVSKAIQTVLPLLIWRVGYLLLSAKRGTLGTSRFRDHLVYLSAIWHRGATPYGKGLDYLNQYRRDSGQDVAASQLSGLKLLGLAWILVGVRALLGAVARGDGPALLAAALGHHRLGLPTLTSVVRDGGLGGHSLATLWATVLFGLFSSVLDVAIQGHFIVGVIRLFGFAVFRNTYRPLLASSIIDFWNRYYYYFKELLLEFFFFPTFLSVFKRRPRLRLFAAVMASAFLGNTFYHLLRDLPLYLDWSSRAGHALASRAIYAFALGLGVFWSMTREQRRRGTAAVPPSGLRRVRAIAGVWLFFGLLHIWNAAPVGPEIGDRLAVMLALVGWHP